MGEGGEAEEEEEEAAAAEEEEGTISTSQTNATTHCALSLVVERTSCLGPSPKIIHFIWPHAWLRLLRCSSESGRAKDVHVAIGSVPLSVVTERIVAIMALNVV